jgi:hypothetical protein
LASKQTGIGRIDVPATAACLATLVFRSIGPICIKYLAGYVGPWSQNALRYSVACLFRLPFLLFIMRRGTFDSRTWRRAILPPVANRLSIINRKSSIINPEAPRPRLPQSSIRNQTVRLEAAGRRLPPQS